MELDRFSTLREYFERQLARQPAQAQRVLVLDPPGLLGLGETVEVEGRRWLVFRYDGNDLAFRKVYGRYGPDTPSPDMGYPAAFLGVPPGH
jgi:hypothetical protein